MDDVRTPVLTPKAAGASSPAIKSRMDLAVGDLIIYPFLWGWRVNRGLTSADKMRPCVIVERQETDQGTMVAILPSTTHQGKPWHDRVTIPREECARVGMDVRRQTSFGLNDYNVDYIETSTFLRMNVPIRSFSEDFMKTVRADFVEVLKNRRSFQVTRTPDREADFAI